MPDPYGLSYTGTPDAGLGLNPNTPSGTGLQAPSYSSSSIGNFNPNYSLANTPSDKSTPAAGGGWWGDLSTGQKAGVVGAGLGALTLATRGGGGGGDINIDPFGLGGTAAEQAKQLWGMYGRGEITPADQGRIGNWEQQQVQAAKDYYSRAGLSDSSMAQEHIGQIGQQAQQMRLQANQALLAPAIQASGIADSYARQMVAYQMQKDQQSRDAQQNLMATLGTIAAIAF